MKKFLIALAFLPFAAGIASAGQALTDQQMDRVTAGFLLPGFALANAGADAYAGGIGGIAITSTYTDAASGFWGARSSSNSFSLAIAGFGIGGFGIGGCGICD